MKGKGQANNRMQPTCYRLVYQRSAPAKVSLVGVSLADPQAADAEALGPHTATSRRDAR